MPARYHVTTYNPAKLQDVEHTVGELNMFHCSTDTLRDQFNVTNVNY